MIIRIVLYCYFKWIKIPDNSLSLHMLIKGSINYPGTEHSKTVSFIHSMKSNSYKA